MKGILFTAVASLCLAAGGPALAQENSVEAQIPFEFCVGDHVLPAGSYMVAPCGPQWQPLIMVRNQETGQAAVNITRLDPYYPAESPGKLVFHQYGNQYFLREIHGSPIASNVLLPLSTRERRVQEETGRVKVFEHITVPTAKD